jgi:CRP-like cAMP-binding protein
MSTRRKTPVQVETVDPAVCSANLRLSILKQAPFFSGLQEADIALINKQFREYGYRSGEPIYFSGETAAHVYLVASGQVKLLQHTTSGQDVLLNILKPGDYFGSLTAVADELYSETALAHTAVCVLGIRTESFRTILGRNPSITLKILDITAKRLLETQETVRRLSTDSVERRIAANLLKLAYKVGEITGEGMLIQMPLSRDDLAQMTGTTTETTSRVISQFQKEGLVRSGRQWLAVVDISRLEKVAHTDLA